MDIALSQLRSRFEQLKLFESIFEFLFSASKLVSLDDDELKSSCMNFANALKNGDAYNVDEINLYS